MTIADYRPMFSQIYHTGLLSLVVFALGFTYVYFVGASDTILGALFLPLAVIIAVTIWGANLARREEVSENV